MFLKGTFETILSCCLILPLSSAAFANTNTETDGTQKYEEIFNEAAREVDVPSKLTKAIAQVESRTTPWTLNIAGRAFFYDTKEEALAAAERAKAAGKSFDTGLMQVNNWWLKRYDIPLETALDPSANILLGSWILKQAMLQHPDDTWTAVGKYHSPNASRGKSYAAQVRRALELGPVSERKTAKTGKKLTDSSKSAAQSAMRPKSQSVSRKFNQQVVGDTDAPLVVYTKPKPVFNREAPTAESKAEAQREIEIAQADTREDTDKTANAAERTTEKHAKEQKNENFAAPNTVAETKPERRPELEDMVPAVLVREPPPETGRIVFSGKRERDETSDFDRRGEFVRRMQ